MDFLACISKLRTESPAVRRAKEVLRDVFLGEKVHPQDIALVQDHLTRTEEFLQAEVSQKWEDHRYMVRVEPDLHQVRAALALITLIAKGDSITSQQRKSLLEEARVELQKSARYGGLFS